MAKLTASSHPDDQLGRDVRYTDTKCNFACPRFGCSQAVAKTFLPSAREK